jgi:hypothetical protein
MNRTVIKLPASYVAGHSLAEPASDPGGYERLNLFSMHRAAGQPADRDSRNRAAAATRPAGFRRPRTRPCATDLGLLLRRTSVESARPAPAGTGLADPPASSIHREGTRS